MLNNLSRWIRKYRAVIGMAVVRALDLLRNPAQSNTHFLQLIVVANGESGFTLQSAMVLDIKDIHHQAFISGLQRLTSAQLQSQVAQRGSVAGAIVECPPLAPHLLPIGGFEYAIKETEADNWLKRLRDGLSGSL